MGGLFMNPGRRGKPLGSAQEWMTRLVGAGLVPARRLIIADARMFVSFRTGGWPPYYEQYTP